MKCAWDNLLAVVPQRLRTEVDRLGRQTLEELHLRLGQPVELLLGGSSYLMNTKASAEDIRFVVNTASRYSPWAAATVSKGYLTATGGHRIGICGECVIQGGQVTTIKEAYSLCIRVARDFPGIGKSAPDRGSLLILGPPGAGKTTLLRDIIRQRSNRGMAISVVDERGELFPGGGNFDPGARTDVLYGCNKPQGVELVLRTMGPKCIAVDEITAPEDCQALISALWCGVDLLATAHAADCKDLNARPVYRPLAQTGLFDRVIVLNRDKSWHMERM